MSVKRHLGRRHPAARARWLQGLAAAAAVLLGLTLAPAVAGASGEGLTITKAVVAQNPSDIGISNVAGVSGEAFAYQLSYSCTTFDPQGCSDVTITDTLDPALELVAPYPPLWVVGTNGGATTLSIPLGQLQTGSNGSFAVPVRFKTDASLGANATRTVDNVARIAGRIGSTSYTGESETVQATGRVRPVGGALAAVVVNPTSVTEFTGAPVAVTVRGTNAGTTGATSLIVSNLDADFFAAFDITSIDAPTLPTGATGAVLEVTTDGVTWTTVTGPYTPAGHLAGVRVTFTGDIAAGATGSLTYTATLRDELVGGGQVVTGNEQVYTADIAVEARYADPYINKGTSASAGVKVIGEVVNPPSLTKTFSPATTVAGYTGTVTTTLSSTGSGSGGMSSMSLVDPAEGGQTPFGETLLLTGAFTVATWPQGAEQAVLTVTCPSGATAEATTTSGRAGALTAPSLPAGCDYADVTGFRVAFTSTGGTPIASNATAKVEATSTVAASAANGVYTNDAQVDVVSASGSSANRKQILDVPFTVSTPKAAIETTKSFTRSTFKVGSATQSTTIQLRTVYGPNGSGTNVSAGSVTIQDPKVLPSAGTVDFFDQFDIQSVRATDCATGDTLAIEYLTGAGWAALPGDGCQLAKPIDMTSLDAQGIRFVYSNTAGIAPGRTFQPEVVVRARVNDRETGTPVLAQLTKAGDTMTSAPNCSTAAAAIDGSTVATDDADTCPTVRFEKVGGDGRGGIDKKITSPADASGREGSRTQVSGTIGLSSRPSSPIAQLVLQDPVPGDVYSETFAAVMDVVSVGSFKVPAHERARIEYLVDGSWVDAGNGWKTGGQDVKGNKNINATAWRLILEEDPGSPGVDPGIEEATWDSLATAPVKFSYQLRDTFRTDIAGHRAGDPVLNNICYTVDGTKLPENSSGLPTGSCQLPHAPFDGPSFNNGASNPTDAGWILNDARATFVRVGGGEDSVTSGSLEDQVFRITNGVVNAQLAKSFSKPDVPMPATGQQAGPLQDRTVTLTARNTSGLYVDELRITDADAGFWAAFELRGITVKTKPGGFSSATYDLTFSDGTAPAAGLTLEQVNALGNLAAVNGIVAHIYGDLAHASNNAAAIELHVRLRASVTSTGVISDTAQVQAFDIVANSQVSPATASITVREPGAVVTTEKSIVLAPGEIAAIDSEPMLDVTVRTANAGELDFAGIVSEDDDIVTPAQYPAGTVLPSNVDGDFWALTDFVGFTAITAPVNAETFAVEVFDGQSWTAVGTYPAGAPVAEVNAALDPAGVEGVRIRYTSTTGEAIHAGEFGEARFQVTLHDTAPVNVPLVNCAEAAFGDGSELRWLNPTCASFTPLPGEPKVSIDKVFSNSKQHDAVDASGTTQRYTITVTNTGTARLGKDAPFSIVDTLSPLLAYNVTTANPVVTLPSGASTLAGTPTPQVSADGSTVTWAWPAGQTLAPGESVVLEVSFDLGAAIPVGTDVPNIAGVPMPNATFCTSTTPYSGYANGQCQSKAIVKVNSQAAIRAVTTVQGTGVTTAVPGAPVPCPTSGFVANPCVAIAPMDSTYTWKLDLLNSGNTALSDVVLIDVLPAASDTGAFLALERGTEWRGAPISAPTTNTLPGGVTASFQYLPAGSDLAACVAEVRGQDTPACGAWVDLAPGEAIPADAIALRVAADYGMGGKPVMAPGERLTITWDEKSPSALTGAPDNRDVNGQPNADTRLTQWDSFGYRVTESATGSKFLNESNKAGVVFDAANLDIAKKVQEDTVLEPADFGTFTVGYSCVSPVAGAAVITGSVQVGHGEHRVVSGLPTGSVCTLTEDAAPEASAWSPADADETQAGYQVELGASFATVTATLTNVYAAHSLTVAKSVLGPVPAGTVFPFAVACTYGGSPLALPAEDASFGLAGGATRVIGNLPLGAVCTVTETDAKGADVTTVAVAGGKPVDGAAVEATIPSGNAQVDFANNFGTNGLTVSKVVEGTLDEGFEVGPFAIEVSCSDPVNGPIERTWSLEGGQSGVLDGLANDTVCTVEETDDGNAHDVRILVDGVESAEGLIRIGDGTNQTVQVQVINTYEAGSLALTKELVGEPSVSEWKFEVTCTWEGQTIVRTLTATEAGTPVVLTGLPVGASCTVEEADNGQDEVTYDTEGPYVIEEAGQTVTVTATNEYLGELTVTKAVDNRTVLTDEQIAALRFPIAVACTYGGEVVLEDEQDYADGQSETFTGLPVGSECTVEETDAGGASHTTVMVGDAEPAVGLADEATVVDGPLEVLVRNTYAPLAITVTKTLDGAPTAQDQQAVFAFAIGCVWHGSGSDLTLDLAEVEGVTDGAFTLRAGESITIDGLPYPSTCTVTETGRGDADSTTYSVDGAQPTQSAATVELGVEQAGEDGAVAVAVVNRYEEVAVSAAPPAPSAPTGKPLANTGVHAAVQTAVGLLVLAVGAAMVLAARRRGEEG